MSLEPSSILLAGKRSILYGWRKTLWMLRWTVVCCKDQAKESGERRAENGELRGRFTASLAERRQEFDREIAPMVQPERAREMGSSQNVVCWTEAHVKRQAGGVKITECFKRPYIWTVERYVCSIPLNSTQQERATRTPSSLHVCPYLTKKKKSSDRSR